MRSKATGYRKWRPTSKLLACRRLVEGRFVKGEASVIIEQELPIHVNGQHLVTASITPSMEKEFVTGYLFGQGFINSVDEIVAIAIDDNAAYVKLKDTSKVSGPAQGASYRIVSGGGRVAYYSKVDLPQIKSREIISRAQIFKAMNILFETARIYRETEGVHAAGLFTNEGSLVCIVEDIGRHNCLDKAIGYALLNKVDLGNTFLVSTGRMSSEMVAKICRAGIPLAATKTAVTDRGLEIGRKHGMTIIGFVRDAGTRLHTDMDLRVINQAGMKIYTDTGRVPCEDDGAQGK
jgi:FdhD protein